MIRSQKRTNLLENNWTRPSKPAKIYTMEIEEIKRRKDIVEEACDKQLFAHFIKGYLGWHKSDLLVEMAEAFLGRKTAKVTNDETTD